MGSLVNKQIVDLSKERIQHSPTIDKVDVDNIGHFETKAQSMEFCSPAGPVGQWI